MSLYKTHAFFQKTKKGGVLCLSEFIPAVLHVTTLQEMQASVVAKHAVPSIAPHVATSGTIAPTVAIVRVTNEREPI